MIVYDERRKTLYRYQMPKVELKFDRPAIYESDSIRLWTYAHWRGVFNPVYPTP